MSPSRAEEREARPAFVPTCARAKASGGTEVCAGPIRAGRRDIVVVVMVCRTACRCYRRKRRGGESKKISRADSERVSLPGGAIPPANFERMHHSPLLNARGRSGREERASGALGHRGRQEEENPLHRRKTTSYAVPPAHASAGSTTVVFCDTYTPSKNLAFLTFREQVGAIGRVAEGAGRARREVGVSSRRLARFWSKRGSNVPSGCPCS